MLQIGRVRVQDPNGENDFPQFFKFFQSHYALLFNLPLTEVGTRRRRRRRKIIFLGSKFAAAA
jgi:hypothetical protein